eukprot:NODE_1096_length_1108_cov_265.655335_g840_i0.p1 GENE.NODE_1096_length_1108_cov_265.655335_g840_i0~~NODE_1096_length_1108_cov_265.655335_g840_i0.p1  ORF type:complete len:321 (-),score=42.11 NODE_1096_length_1108_cov_265.655335_g840_i0:95-1057(-)
MRFLLLFFLAVAVSAKAPNGLYGLVEVGQRVQLCRLDPQSGNRTIVGSSLDGILVGEGETVLDDTRGLMYVIAYNNSLKQTAVVAISLETGSKVNEIVLPYLPERFIGVGEGIAYDPATNEIFVYGPDPADITTHLILAVDPTKKTVKKVGEIPAGFNTVLGGATGFAERTLWVSLNQKSEGATEPKILTVVGFNVDTGKQTVTANPWYLEAMSTDPTASSNRQLVGLGLTGGSRWLLGLSGSTGVQTKLAQLTPAYFMIGGPQFGLDYVNQKGYAWLGRKGNNHVYYLVTINMKDATVTESQATFTSQQLGWGLNYYVG